MFQKLITYSIRHKLVIGVLSIALAIWGVWSLVHLPFDSTPDITDNQVQVITQAPSLGAQEVEQYVTTPVGRLQIYPASRNVVAFQEADSRLSRLSSTMPPISIGHVRR